MFFLNVWGTHRMIMMDSKAQLTVDVVVQKDDVVKRQPLTIEAFNAIREKADPWFQKAMDLALESLQSRAEIASAKFADIDGDTWKVIRKKTKSYGVSARLKIKMWPELAKVLDACRDAIASPYIVHKLPRRKQKTKAQAILRDHPTQGLPEDISRAFATARNKTELFEDWGQFEKPSFHEIRALGADLKRKAGWPNELIQQLMAHSDKEMTNHYLDKHETPWTKVERE